MSDSDPPLKKLRNNRIRVLMKVTKREIESARDALIRHTEIWERSDAETILIFEEMIRKVRKAKTDKEQLH